MFRKLNRHFRTTQITNRNMKAGKRHDGTKIERNMQCRSLWSFSIDDHCTNRITKTAENNNDRNPSTHPSFYSSVFQSPASSPIAYPRTAVLAGATGAPYFGQP
ncbi:hypothetical protein AB6A40_005520 [Gnathostoma spinigerum]|uniref:Uncharacterized protein n=1 Tax=Gnathostoma spinigerum TaxID=75299 RepID=A0ABD6EHW0_9BILA